MNKAATVLDLLDAKLADLKAILSNRVLTLESWLIKQGFELVDPEDLNKDQLLGKYYLNYPALSVTFTIRVTTYGVLEFDFDRYGETLHTVSIVLDDYHDDFVRFLDGLFYNRFVSCINSVKTITRND